LVLGITLGPGCVGNNEPPAMPRPEERAPVSYLPRDLDVALTLDLARLRQNLPAGATERLLAQGTFGGDEPTAQTLGRALERAQRIWIAFRPSAKLTALDSVVVLEGDFGGAPSEARLSAFLPGRDLGAGLSVFEAKKVSSRASVARLYSWNERLWIAASTAEIDAVERTVELGASESGLIPPSRGVLALALRVGPFRERMRDDSPRGAAFLERATVLELSGDLAAEGLRVRADLEFETPEAAQTAQRALGLLLELLAEGSPGLFAGSPQSEIVERTLTVELKIAPERLLAWLQGS